MALVFNPFTGNFDFAGGDATASLLNLKGQVATVAALPSSGNTIGDVWQVTADLTFRVWDGAAWDNLGTFQGPAGQNVELQKTATHIQWRVVGGTWANLVALSEITGPQGAAGVNVNADWTAASGDAQILNKPALGSAAALNVGTGANNVVQLDGSARLPAVDGSQLTNLPGGGGGSAVIHPGYRAGTLIGGFNINGALVTTTSVVGQPCHHPIYIPVAQTFTQILCRTWSNYAGTSTVILGVYDHDATTNSPRNKVYDSGQLTITASGAANYGPGTISLTLQPGLYWLTFLSLANGTTPSFAGPPSSAPGMGYPFYTAISIGGVTATMIRGGGGATELRATETGISTDGQGRPSVFLVV